MKRLSEEAGERGGELIASWLSTVSVSTSSVEVLLVS